MSWQLLVGLSILLYSINGLLHRTLMKDAKSDPYAQTIMFNGLVGVFSLIIMLLSGKFPAIATLEQLAIMIPLTIFMTLGTICAFNGTKLIEASENAILITSSKLWLILGALLFLQESFSLPKFIGAVLVLGGIAYAQWRKSKFVFNTGAVYVLLAALLYSSGEILSYYILRSFDALSLIIYITFFSTVALSVIRLDTFKKLSFYFKPKYAANIIVVSFNDTLATLFGFIAYQIGRNALQIGPLMATQTIVTVVLALIILKETDHLFQKISGAVIVVIGSLLLIN